MQANATGERNGEERWTVNGVKVKVASQLRTSSFLDVISKTN